MCMMDKSLFGRKSGRVEFKGKGSWPQQYGNMELKVISGCANTWDNNLFARLFSGGVFQGWVKKGFLYIVAQAKSKFPNSEDKIY